MTTTALSITGMLSQAMELEEKDHAEKEVIKRGVLRAGNSGIILPNGNPTASCARLAHLRSLGIDSETVGADRRIMFGGGISNEGYWLRQLSTVWDGEILCEAEIPIEWSTTRSTKVTGRPDLVLCRSDPDGPIPHPRDGLPLVPVLGLELKMVSAFNTARTVLFKGAPKLNHLCQAGHYSWKLGIPFRLVYTSYIDHSIPAWGTQGLPKINDPLAVHCQFNDRGQVKKILPFVRVYELQWDANGFLQYRVEGSKSKWVTTIVSQSGIANYYDVVDAMGPGQPLAPRPETLTATGEKEGWTNCAYCALNKTCEERDYSRWLSAVKELRGIEA